LFGLLTPLDFPASTLPFFFQASSLSITYVDLCRPVRNWGTSTVAAHIVPLLYRLEKEAQLKANRKVRAGVGESVDQDVTELPRKKVMSKETAEAQSEWFEFGACRDLCVKLRRKIKVQFVVRKFEV
jgi:hypothetical protein